jgi:hypothetical protein
VDTLTELYATGTRKVPAGTATGFVPTRWVGYLHTARQRGDVTAYRHYWELCVLLALRDGLAQAGQDQRGLPPGVQLPPQRSGRDPAGHQRPRALRDGSELVSYARK